MGERELQIERADRIKWEREAKEAKQTLALFIEGAQMQAKELARLKDENRTLRVALKDQAISAVGLAERFPVDGSECPTAADVEGILRDD